MDRIERREKISTMYTQDGKSINQISKELGISWDTVKRDLIFLNIETDSKRNQYGRGNGISDDLFKIISDADSAYWLGFLYADGSIRKDKNEITLDLKESDLSTIQDFHSYCNNKNSIREHIIKRDTKIFKSYVSGFSNKLVKENLIKLGCAPKKSLTLKFPTEEQVPEKFIYDFIRGYVDGDGYLQYDPSKRKYRIIICGTKNFLEGLISRTGLFEGCRISKDSSSNIYLLSIEQKEVVKKMLFDMYENSRYHLYRKYEIYLKAKGA